jgi:peptide/nickel transport system substrate-binding protein
MQHLINQPQLIRTALGGIGYPDYGPVPINPPTNWATAEEHHNPYPYSVAAAKSLLKGHGWTIDPSGVDTCEKAGSGPGECGAGIAKGAQLNFTMQYASGVTTFNAIVQAMSSSWSLAGIKVTLSAAPAPTVVDTAYTCASSPSPSDCNRDFENWGNDGFAWTYAYYPTGEDLFKSDGYSNPDGYSNATDDSNIVATEDKPGAATLHTYENYLELQLPVIWQPTWPYQISVISKKLHGAVPQDPNLHFYPELWSLS